MQAVFGTSLKQFTNGNGQWVWNPPTGPYAFGAAVQLTALPAPGAYFFGWAGAAGEFANPLFITDAVRKKIEFLRLCFNISSC